MLSHPEERKQNCFSAREEQTTQLTIVLVHHICPARTIRAAIDFKTVSEKSKRWAYRHPNSTGYSLLSIYYTILRFAVLMTNYELHKLGIFFATHRKTYSTRQVTIIRARESILAMTSRKIITTFLHPILHHSMKTCRIEFEIQLNVLSLTLVGGEQTASGHRNFTPRKRLR